MIWISEQTKVDTDEFPILLRENCKFEYYGKSKILEIRLTNNNGTFKINERYGRYLKEKMQNEEKNIEKKIYEWKVDGKEKEEEKKEKKKKSER